MIGEVLNQRYRIESEIGHGGMGKVYLGYDTSLERRVAIKILFKNKLGTEGKRKLINEAQTAAKLNHPNIVTIYDVGESISSGDSERAIPFIVMEYVEGKSLYERHPETLEETLEILCQVCMGLEHAHGQGIIHRDLKPENVVITRDGTAKLMDFGLARSITSRYTTDGTVAGTVVYLPPEQALGQEIDARTDLYSLGVMTYELTTGELPFFDQDPIAVISQHLHAPVVPPRAKNDAIPQALNELIIQLMSKEPRDRPGSAREVLEKLRAIEVGAIDIDQVGELSLLDRIVRGRMVGRELELSQARQLWQKVKSREGQLLLISGEAGIGKSRLVREIITQAEVSGGQTLIGASYAEADMPFGAFKQIVREALSRERDNGFQLPNDTLTNLLIINPELRHRYPDLKENELRDPQTEQQRLLESMVVLCVALSDQASLLLVLEDAQWADSGTLMMLRHLIRNLRHERVMIIVTYREVEPEEARVFYKTLVDLERECKACYLNLKRLNRKQTRDMLAILFAEEITPEFLDGIYNETEGNPFFIEEVCKALVESGKLYFEGGQWHRPSIAELGIPQNVRMAVQSRVQNLPDEQQEILHQAAILGREFKFQILVDASECSEYMVLEALEGAERSQLIDKLCINSGENCLFTHALIPISLTEGLRPTVLRRMHHRAAIAIETYKPDDYEALAYHSFKAGLEEQGVEYLLQAGDRALRLFAHQEAISSYKQAISLLEKVGNFPEAARAQMKLGLTYHNTFEFEESRKAYERGFIIWQRASESSDQHSPALHPFRGIYTYPPTLDPGCCIDDSSSEIIYQLFSGLVELSPNLSVLPDVAHSWEVLEGGRKYRFYLRDDVYWSDGTQVTAGDFEFAWRRVLSPSFNPWCAEFLSMIKGAKDLNTGELVDPDKLGLYSRDPLTLEIELENPTSYFLQLLTHVIAFPIPQHVVERVGEAWTEINNIVTNGPFKLKTWDQEESAVFERNKAYHGQFSGNLERVETSFFTGEKLNLVEKYENDTIDILHLVHLLPAEADIARHRYAGEYITGPEMGGRFIGFDVSRYPLDDQGVRRALTLAISREKLTSIIDRGLHNPATGGLIPPGMPGHTPDIGLPYDPDQARWLLEQAGIKERGCFHDLDCIAPDNPSVLTIIESVKDQWVQNLGIDINWKFMDWAQFLERLDSHSANMWYMGFTADYPDPDYVMRVVWDYTNRDSRWDNSTFEQLVNEAWHLMDQEKRIELYQRADRMLVEEAPILPLNYGRFNRLVKPWIRNLLYSPVNPPFWKYIVIDPHSTLSKRG